MTRTMHDSVTVGDIPATATMVAGYVDGHYRNVDQLRARFPHATIVEIAVSARTNAGDVLDVEKGDATPTEARGWITMRQAAGLARPTIYCPASLIGEVVQACKGLDYDIWSAHYRTSASKAPWVDPGCVATQYADPLTSGGHFDLSLVADDGWPHRGAPAPTPTPGGDDDMTDEQFKKFDTNFYFVNVKQDQTNEKLDELIALLKQLVAKG